MSGGSVHPTTGEFNFSVDEAYLIEKGKITKQVKGAKLVGYGSQILPNIDMVGNNMAYACRDVRFGFRQCSDNRRAADNQGKSS